MGNNSFSILTHDLTQNIMQQISKTLQCSGFTPINRLHGMQGVSGSNPLGSILKNPLQLDFAIVLERGI
jgi:hypothetical protein